MTENAFRLDGRRVLFTGALGIIGSTAARTLADAGAALVIADLDGDAAAARAKELTDATGCSAIGLGVNVADEASVAALAERIEADGLKIDVLVNGAAAKSPAFFAPIGEFPLDDWNQVFGVNVAGIFLMVRALLPGMVARGRGNIVSFGSIYGQLGPDQRIYDGAHYEAMGGAINTPLAYSATKGAVAAMMRHIATTHGGDGIRANTLVPGGVKSGQNETFIKNYSARVPTGRMAEAQEIADALLFMASDASAYMSGQEMVVDGGLSAW